MLAMNITLSFVFMTCFVIGGLITLESLGALLATNIKVGVSHKETNDTPQSSPKLYITDRPCSLYKDEIVEEDRLSDLSSLNSSSFDAFVLSEPEIQPLVRIGREYSVVPILVAPKQGPPIIQYHC